jgi:hypothetical protein
MGCLKNVLAGIGCAVVLAVAVFLGFHFRRDIAALYHRLRGAPEPARVAFVTPGPRSAERADSSLAALSRRGGPVYVDLGADELAALIERRLASGPRPALDSVGVSLGNGRVEVHGSLDVASLPHNLLGPLAAGLGRREPVTAGGTLAVAPAGSGRVRWTIDALAIRDFPFPRAVIPRLLGALGIEGASGASLPLPLPVRVGEVRVTPRWVRAYRTPAP